MKGVWDTLINLPHYSDHSDGRVKHYIQGRSDRQKNYEEFFNVFMWTKYAAMERAAPIM